MPALSGEKTKQSRRLALPGRGQVVALCVVLLVCLGLFAWVGYVFLPDASQLSRREIVNDDYNTVTAPLGAGDVLTQRLFAEGRLYGVVLDVATYNRVAQGTLTLELQDEGGARVAGCTTDMTKLLDNTFHRFIFDEMVNAGGGAWYTLVITLQPAAAADVLGFHASSGPAQDFVEAGEEEPHYPLEGFTLTQNGQPLQGTLALQYIVRYSAGFLMAAYSFFAALLTVFMLALYWLVFVAKAPLHRIFILCALVLGFVFMFLIPPRTAPDEYVHITNAYHYTNLVLGVEGDSPLQENGTLMMRPGDEMMLNNYDFDATDVFAYQDLYEGLWQRAPGGEMVPVTARGARVFPLMNLIPTAGVLLARLWGVGRVGLLLLGRLANLLFYTIVVSRGIKRMPVAKPMLFCVALLPMCLQLAASFSYDTFVLALAFYYIASCLQLALEKEKVGLWDLVRLSAIALLLAPAKAVYLLILPLIYFIPKAKYPSARACHITRNALMAAALILCVTFNLASVRQSIGKPVVAPTAAPAGQALSASGEEALLTPAPADKTPLNTTPAVQDAAETQPAPKHASQTYTLGYILSHIPQTIKVVLRTLWEQGPLWLQGLVGGRLGEIIAIDLEINWLFTLALLAIPLLAAVPTPQDSLVLKKSLRLSLLVISLLVIGLFSLACLTWTPIDYPSIFGIQGRYFLPVLPLLLLAARGGYLRFSKNPAAVLCYALPAVVLLCQLDAFTLVIQR